MVRGLIPHDMQLVGSMVKDISYFNAKRYFNFQPLTNGKGFATSMKNVEKVA